MIRVCVGRVYRRRFLNVLAACFESEGETHGDSLNLCMCCRMHRVINYTKKPREINLRRVINNLNSTIMPLHKNSVSELIV